MQLVIILLLVVVAVGGGVFFFIRRRSQNEIADLPPPDIGDLVDYTSEPEEEPETFGDRLRNVSPAIKALMVLVPLLVVVLIITVGAFALLGGGGDETATPEPEIEITKADMIDEDGTIKVEADTTLPDGTRVTAVLLEDGEEIAWFSDDAARVNAREGVIDMTLPREEDAPYASRSGEQIIQLTAEVNGETIEDSERLDVIKRFELAFYGPETTPTPTEAPATPTPEVRRTTPAAPTPAPVTPTSAPPQGIALVVGNGGNVRAQPSAEASIVASVTLGDEVQVLQKTADSVWYEIQTDQGLTGWAHRVVLQPDASVAAQVPVAGQDAPPPTDSTGLTATVFNGGNVRAQPALADNIVGGVNANETVELLGKTADGVWFKIRNERNVEGWAHNTLLTVPPDVAAQVPIAQG